MQHKVNYVGKAEYCYANSAAMLLTSIGEEVSPNQIEASAGIGLGAFIITNTNQLFFSPLAVAPDVGLTKSFNIMGFEFEERSFNQEELPLEELKKVLETSAVLIGPLDMGFLTYQKHSSPPYGADHFVLVYGIDNEKVYLHDPYGYPNAYLTFDELKPTWKADNIGYKLGPYHWWHSIKRTSNPSQKEIYEKTMEYFKFIYQESRITAKKENRLINKEAILNISSKLEQGEIDKNEIGLLTGFALPLSAKRASDYANFFKEYNPKVANIKEELSVLFGHTHVLLMGDKKHEASVKLKEIAHKEEEFQKKLFE